MPALDACGEKRLGQMDGCGSKCSGSCKDKKMKQDRMYAEGWNDSYENALVRDAAAGMYEPRNDLKKGSGRPGKKCGNSYIAANATCGGAKKKGGKKNNVWTNANIAQKAGMVAGSLGYAAGVGKMAGSAMTGNARGTIKGAALTYGSLALAVQSSAGAYQKMGKTRLARRARGQAKVGAVAAGALGAGLAATSRKTNRAMGAAAFRSGQAAGAATRGAKNATASARRRAGRMTESYRYRRRPGERTIDI